MSSMEFEMGAHWQDTAFVLQALNVYVSCAASSYEQSCVLSGLQFGATYGVCIFYYGRMIALHVDMISSLCLPHLFEARALRMLSVCFALMTVLRNANRFFMNFCDLLEN